MVTQEQEEARTLLDCAFKTHAMLGPGLLERAPTSPLRCA